MFFLILNSLLYRKKRKKHLIEKYCRSSLFWNRSSPPVVIENAPHEMFLCFLNCTLHCKKRTFKYIAVYDTTLWSKHLKLSSMPKKITFFGGCSRGLPRRRIGRGGRGWDGTVESEREDAQTHALGGAGVEDVAAAGGGVRAVWRTPYFHLDYTLYTLDLILTYTWYTGYIPYTYYYTTTTHPFLTPTTTLYYPTTSTTLYYYYTIYPIPTIPYTYIPYTGYIPYTYLHLIYWVRQIGRLHNCLWGITLPPDTGVPPPSPATTFQASQLIYGRGRGERCDGRVWGRQICPTMKAVVWANRTCGFDP